MPPQVNLKSGVETVEVPYNGKRKSPKNLKSLKSLIDELSPWEFLFKILTIGFICWAIYNLRNVYIIHTDPQYSEFKMNSIYDFKFSLISAALFWLFRYLMDKYFYSTAYSLIDKTKFTTEEERMDRSKKYCKWTGSIIYYSISTIACYLLFRDQYFFPSILGGKSECSNIFQHYPNLPHIPYAQEFYMIQFGVHLYTLLDHVFIRYKEPKFYEVLLHHGMAVFLIFFSYLTNAIAIGILVLFIHDPGDIFLDLSRTYNDYAKKKKPLLALIFGVFIGQWIYLRLFTFPACIIGAAMDYYQKIPYQLLKMSVFQSPHLYLIMMLTALVGLHLFWFVFILKIQLAIIKNRKDANLYDNKRKSG